MSQLAACQESLCKSAQTHDEKKHVCLLWVLFQWWCLSRCTYLIAFHYFSYFKQGLHLFSLVLNMFPQYCHRKQRLSHFYLLMHHQELPHNMQFLYLWTWNRQSLRSWCSAGRTAEGTKAGSRSKGGRSASGIICQDKLWSSWWQPCTLEHRKNTSWQAVVQSPWCVHMYWHQCRSVQCHFHSAVILQIRTLKQH